MSGDSKDTSVSEHIEQGFDSVTNFVSDKYDAATNYVSKELNNIGFSEHQQIGLIMIFFVISLIIFGASLYWYFSWKRTPRSAWCCGQPDEKFIVYRRKVEFEPIIVVKPPAANDRGQLPI